MHTKQAYPVREIACFAMQVLVDTSVWIDHLRRGDPELVAADELLIPLKGA